MVAAAACAGLGAVALLGWIAGEPGLIRVLPEYRPVRPVVAVGLMLGGIALFAATIGSPRSAQIAAAVAGALGVVAAIQAVAGVELSPASLPMDDVPASTQQLGAAPPAPRLLSSAMLFLLGLALLWLRTRHVGLQRVGAALSSIGLAVAFLSVIGFILLLDAPQLSSSILLPVHMALVLGAAFAAALAVAPRPTWVTTLLGRTWRGRIARILLMSAAIPIPLAWLADRGHSAGIYGVEIRMLVIVLGAVLILAVVALSAAALLGDERRERDELARALDLSANLLRDASGRIIYWSRGCEALYGWTAEEALGRHCDELLGACTPEAPVISHELEAGRGFWQGEVQHRARDGRRVVVMVRAVMHDRGSARRPVMLLSMSDVTEQRRAHEEIVERDAHLLQLQSELLEVSRLNSMGEMAAALAHELNQPLTAAANFLGAAELGLTKLSPAAEPEARDRIARTMRRARDETLRAGEIVRRLREFIARGDVDMRRESLPEIIKDAVQLGLAKAPPGTIAVDLELDPAAEFVLADRVQIQQVIVNLVRNAAEALLTQGAPDRNLIRLSTRCASREWVEVSISDMGPGLTPAIADSAFTPFTSTKATGMGVGLSISKRIVEAHGGEIWLAETSAGGTTFTFTIPLFQALEALDEQ